MTKATVSLALLISGSLLAFPTAVRADETYEVCGAGATGFIRIGGYMTCLKSGTPNAASSQTGTGTNTDAPITQKQLDICREVLKDGLKDPDSYKEVRAFTEGGGLIRYTATNGYGGRTTDYVNCRVDFPTIFQK